MKATTNISTITVSQQASGVNILAVSVKDVAQSLGVHANTVRNLVRRGQLRTLPGLRSLRITTASLNSYVATPAAR